VRPLRNQRAAVIGSFLPNRFGAPEKFFERHFVVNYCPLAFWRNPAQSNPDKLTPEEKTRLSAACDAHLRAVFDIRSPKWVIGIGASPPARLPLLRKEPGSNRPDIASKPSSPAANRDWSGQVTAQLQALGIWK